MSVFEISIHSLIGLDCICLMMTHVLQDILAVLRSKCTIAAVNLNKSIKPNCIVYVWGQVDVKNCISSGLIQVKDCIGFYIIADFCLQISWENEIANIWIDVYVTERCWVFKCRTHLLGNIFRISPPSLGLYKWKMSYSTTLYGYFCKNVLLQLGWKLTPTNKS